MPGQPKLSTEQLSLESELADGLFDAWLDFYVKIREGHPSAWLRAVARLRCVKAAALLWEDDVDVRRPSRG
jgi:hypothetical protein